MFLNMDKENQLNYIIEKLNNIIPDSEKSAIEFMGKLKMCDDYIKDHYQVTYIKVALKDISNRLEIYRDNNIKP